MKLLSYLLAIVFNLGGIYIAHLNNDDVFCIIFVVSSLILTWNTLYRKEELF